ncbi:MAG: acetamidase/formamidase family protein [Xanthobacteraceae bacterium]
MSKHHTLRASVGTVHRGAFDSALAPVLTISSGDVVEVTALSGNPDQLPCAESGFTVLPEHCDVLARVPPGEGPHLLTGPIAVEGAVPGDELVVDVLDMKLAQDWGWNRFAPGMGALPEQFPDARCIHIAIDRTAGTVTLPWGLKLKAAPFFGIIGVAPPPAMGCATSIVPRAFGGNIDNKHFGAGATVHLPVFNPGALLSLGDGHALQGDGEVCLTAIETALTGTLRVSLVKNTGIARPWAETSTHVITMAFDPDLDVAAASALREMIKLIEQATGLSAADAYSLCSIAADMHVTQLVNLHKGIHVLLAKETLQKA